MSSNNGDFDVSHELESLRRHISEATREALNSKIVLEEAAILYANTVARLRELEETYNERMAE